MENGTQITLLELDPNLYQRQNVTVSDFRARLSALRDIEEDLKILEELYSLKSCGLLKKDTLKYYSLKMSPDCLTMRGGVTFEVIIETMAELGYFVEWQVCNSKYFGVPQNRERVFIIGHLGTGHGREVFPVGVHDRPADELQGQRNNNRMISNTLDTRIKGNTRGTYPIIGGGYSEGQRLPQGLIGGTAEHKKPRLTDIAMTLDTRIGALPGFNETYVIVPNESNTDRKHNAD